MFTNYTSKIHPFDIYNNIAIQFNTIKNSSFFSNYTTLSSVELINVININLDCIEKLGDISAFYLKKLTDTNSSMIINEQLTQMLNIHMELLDKMYQFNNLSTDVSDNIKEIMKNNFSQDIQNFINYDVLNKHKLLIIQIIETIKRINIYVNLLKIKIIDF